LVAFAPWMGHRIITNRESKGAGMSLRMRVHDREPIALALRRFKKLIERSGMQKELRAHQHYEKPSELRRRARLRKEKSARKAMESTGPM
jgi:small subunit ribosomal protein S21